MKYSLPMRCLLISSALLLGACASGQGMPMAKYAQPEASPHGFDVCHSYSCTQRSRVELSEAEWTGVLRPFKTASKSAKAERVKIAKAVAEIETLVVKNTGITPDRAEANTVRDGKYQMDCIDETVNTDRYLGFLEDAGVLKFHEKAEPLHRGFFVDGKWPHNTAAVAEIDGGAVYAIDSYYHDNGVKVEIVPKATWVQGWRP